MSKKTTYRWVEPETTYFDEEGKKVTIPAHQEEGEYYAEANIVGYIIVTRNGRKHLVADRDIVGIFS